MNMENLEKIKKSTKLSSLAAEVAERVPYNIEKFESIIGEKIPEDQMMDIIVSASLMVLNDNDMLNWEEINNRVGDNNDGKTFADFMEKVIKPLLSGDSDDSDDSDVSEVSARDALAELLKHLGK